jgi:tetratricopeptide (TPR) repeat protein
MTLAEELFLAVADLPASEREQYLRAHCSNDDILREVESLLAADSGSHDFLESTVARAAIAMEQSAQPSLIGNWRVGNLIGSGGMGNVYLAERNDPAFQQRAAIKILNRRLAGQARRFLRERNILARLTHPNIAQLFDAGITPEGLPYLVLEFVEGQPLDTFVEQNHLDLKSCLNLFRSIAAAVEYAHRNLIVHRDLKPANILVTSEGIPKLLDFGIAQVLEDSDSQPVTLAMTLDYASPEQARGDAPNPSMDVYALGVILCKLVTGQTPFALDKLPPDQAIERLRNAELRLSPDIPLDLTRILEKALAKEVSRRYGSVEMLSADVERFLRREPVEARGGETLYRFIRFAQRRWIPLTAAAVVFIATLVALLVTRQALQEAQLARARTEAERQRADSMTLEAQRQRDLAELRARDLTEQVARADRNLATARLNAATVTRMLDQQFVSGGGRQALATVEEWLKVQSQVVERNSNSPEAIKLLGILEGRRCGFASSENTKAAQEYCESSVRHLAPLEGSEHDDEWFQSSLATSRAMLGRLYAAEGKVAEGLAQLTLARKALEPAIKRNPADTTLIAQRATIGLYHADALVKAGRQDEAASLYTLSLAQLRSAKSQPLNRALSMQLAAASTRLAKLFETRNPARSKNLFRESLEAYRQLAEAPQSAMIDWNEYANALNECPFPDLRLTTDAVRFAQKAVEATQSKNPGALDTLAWAYHRAGRKDEAIATQRKAISLLPPAAAAMRKMLEKALAEFEAASGR